MSVRKRKWTTGNGEQKESWVIDYVDQQGDRHIKTFAKKKDAEKRHASVAVDVDRGTHTAASKSITVAQAAQDWLKFIELEGRERATSCRIESTLTGTSCRASVARKLPR